MASLAVPVKMVADYKNATFQLFQFDNRPVDLELARRQHAALVAALRALGIDVLELPPEESNALSVFTQVRENTF